MEFETSLTEKEIENNLSKIIRSDFGIVRNISTLFFGDISKNYQYDGYIKNNNFYLVSYRTKYRKNIEIKGTIKEIGNIRKVAFNINWLMKVDVLFIIFFINLVLVYILNFEGFSLAILLIVSIILWITVLFTIIQINKLIILKLSKLIFKIIITGEQ
ncbi:hypothetical protein [Breznakiella homolactica]|uniref:Uncharacterized protein n=1 Tax=Breznakiella homolactica TaxID=2798577 RepID=A0A7T7XQ73_9SPIR|nr:hypothetical protein [Breznakiella homolactica]QQO10372.1 hypothetical protein JFL75_05490 [Breznakiella homolactica]